MSSLTLFQEGPCPLGQKDPGVTRILLWNSNFWPTIGGLEVMTAELALAVRSLGFDVHILAPSPGPDDFLGIPVHRLPLMEPESYESADIIIDLSRKVRQLLSELSPDIIHLNGIAPCWSIFLLSRRPGDCPFVLTLHGKWPRAADQLVRELFSRVDKLAACSKSTFDYVRENTPTMMSRTVLIRNALPPFPLPAACATEHPNLLLLGRLSKEKGFDLAIRAFGELVQEFPDIHLRLGGSGLEERPLRRLAEELEVSQHVDFLGPIERRDVPTLLRQASIVLVPSRSEGFGLTALEAAWMERPVIASAVGGLPEVVLHGETGLLFEPESSAALAQAVRSLLTNPGLGERLGRTARIQAFQRFDWNRHVEQYAELYRSLT